jgi:hypothetical protein
MHHTSCQRPRGSGILLAGTHPLLGERPEVKPDLSNLLGFAPVEWVD